jgi:hypothetical protein
MDRMMDCCALLFSGAHPGSCTESISKGHLFCVTHLHDQSHYPKKG